MDNNELKPKIETEEETLESYNDFRKRYYIYRTDDIVEYMQRNGTELNDLFQQGQKIYDEINEKLNPTQQKLLSRYSDNWVDILNTEVDELTKYILSDFEEER